LRTSRFNYLELDKEQQTDADQNGNEQAVSPGTCAEAGPFIMAQLLVIIFWGPVFIALCLV